MPEHFDPYAILGSLERNRVAFILIGGLARVIHGTDEITHDVDICPQPRPDNLRRLERAIDELGGQERQSADPGVHEYSTSGEASA